MSLSASIPKGELLNVAVAIEFFRCKNITATYNGRYVCLCPGPLHTDADGKVRDYSGDRQFFWQFIDTIRMYRFSTRTAFFDFLKTTVRTKSGERVQWPDALLDMSPEHVCRAALVAVEWEKERLAKGVRT